MGSERVPLILLQIRSGGGAVAFRTLVPYPMDTVGLITIRRAVFDRSSQVGLISTRIGTAHARVLNVLLAEKREADDESRFRD
jgi:hypothetical protein